MTHEGVRWSDKSKGLAEAASEAGKRFNSAVGGNYTADDLTYPTQVKCAIGCRVKLCVEIWGTFSPLGDGNE